MRIDPVMTRALDTAREAAREASGYLKETYRGQLRVQFKGEVDLVTEHDLRSEELIRQKLRAAFPNFGLLCEEGGTEGPDDPRFIVDPLDGTTNFAHGLPIFAVSIGLECAGVLELGVIDAPVLGSVWVARRGHGATRNGQPIRVSNTPSLDRSLVATGFPYDRRTNPVNNVAEFAKVQTKAQAVRRCGAAVLDLAWLSDGTFDGYWEGKLKPWDWAAGLLMVEEAGGVATNRTGGTFTLAGDYLVASNGLIHDELLSAING